MGFGARGSLSIVPDPSPPNLLLLPRPMSIAITAALLLVNPFVDIDLPSTAREDPRNSPPQPAAKWIVDRA